MKFLIVLCSAIACTLASPAASYAYSAYAPLTYPYYNNLAYSAFPYAYAAQVASPVVASVAAPAVGVKSQYYSDVSGLVSYGHSEPGQSQAAVQDPAGNKVGSFSYVNPEGKVVYTSYVADALGYRVASNDLPVAENVQPAPVADTPEVAAAKAEFFNQYEAVKSRSRRAAPSFSAVPVAYSAYSAPFSYSQYSHPYSPFAYSAYPYSYSPYAFSYSYAK